MNIDSKTLVSISEANQNFSKVARLVDQYGSAVILKNNAPRYMIIDFSKLDEIQEAADEEVLASSRKWIERNRIVFGKEYIPISDSYRDRFYEVLSRRTIGAGRG